MSTSARKFDEAPEPRERPKLVPDEPPKIAVAGRYGFSEAAAVIRASIEDYADMFSHSG